MSIRKAIPVTVFMLFTAAEVIGCSCIASANFCEYAGRFLEYGDTTTCIVEVELLGIRNAWPNDDGFIGLYDMRIERVLYGTIAKGDTVSLFGQDGGNCNGPNRAVEKDGRYLLLFSNHDSFSTYHGQLAESLVNPYPVYNYPGCGPATLDWTGGKVSGPLGYKDDRPLDEEQLPSVLQECLGIDLGAEPLSISPDDLPRIDMRVFPNPVAEVLTVRSEVPLNRMELFDGLGRRVRAAVAGGRTNRLRVEDLPAGVYFLRVASGQRVGERRIVVR